MKKMNEHLDITLPLIVDDINDIPSLEKVVAATIMENQSDFNPLLERLIEMGDARMTVIDNSLNIEAFDVDVDALGGMACGTFDSDFYAGCKDMNSVDDNDVQLPFEIENNNLVFSIKLPPAWIPDYD